MNILIVTQYFWPENFRINDLSLGLQERGHVVEVLTGIPNYPQGQFFPGYRYLNKRRDNLDGIRVHRAPLFPRGRGGSLRMVLNFISFALFASLTAPIFCKEKYDLIFVYEPSPITVGLPALLLRRLKSAPVVFWMQDLWPESLSATGAIKSEFILKMVELMVRFIYKGCDRILAQSKAFIPSIIQLGAEPNRVFYFPNSAEALYQPVKVEDAAPERHKMPDGFRVTFAGNIGAAQDFTTILSAAEILKNYPDIHLMVLGDGRMSSVVKRRVNEMKLDKTVHLLGRHPADTMPRYFALSDALLVTLRKEPIFALTIPSKIQSYLACAKPIIAALDGEGARIVNEAGAGVTCTAENPQGLADAILKLYKMSDADRQDMGKCGHRYFKENFEREILLGRLEEWMIDTQRTWLTN